MASWHRARRESKSVLQTAKTLTYHSLHQSSHCLGRHRTARFHPWALRDRVADNRATHGAHVLPSAQKPRQPRQRKWRKRILTSVSTSSSMVKGKSVAIIVVPAVQFFAEKILRKRRLRCTDGIEAPRRNATGRFELVKAFAQRSPPITPCTQLWACNLSLSLTLPRLARQGLSEQWTQRSTRLTERQTRQWVKGTKGRGTEARPKLPCFDETSSPVALTWTPRLAPSRRCRWVRVARWSTFIHVQCHAATCSSCASMHNHAFYTRSHRIPAHIRVMTQLLFVCPVSFYRNYGHITFNRPSN